MAIDAKEWLADRQKNPPKPELCYCGRPFKPRFDGGPRPQINGKIVCDDCCEESIEASAGEPPDLGGHAHGHGQSFSD